MNQAPDWLRLDAQLCFRLYAASRTVTRCYQPLLAELGPEPLSDDFDAAYLQRELKGKTANIKQAIKKTYSKRGDAVVQKNYDAVDATLAHLSEVTVPGAATSRRASA